MTERSGIEWTEATWNPITGCSKVSAGCKNCYAERLWPRVYGKFRPFTDVQCHEDRLEIPLHWRKPRRIFVNSMSDLFHEKVPFEFILKVWDVICQCPQHTFQILTKRPERALEFARFMAGADDISIAEWPRNTWLGVSVEDQKAADTRLPLLAQVPTSVRWMSIEPMLAPLSLRWLAVFHENAPYTAQRADSQGTNELDGLRRFDWVVVGGESGPKARPFDPDWARYILAQCRAANVPFFMKQFGSNPVAGKLRDGHGGNPEEWPEDLRIRQYPEQEEGK